jgi:arginine decarboxylase
LRERLADKYFCNFSVFQSVPDVWALNQIFPVCPLHRLDERPTRRAIVQDLTCDSDGQIEAYVDGGGIESSLPAHRYQPGEPYFLGIFLVGAYQEILGDMHNLFGDTHAVNVELLEDGGHRLSEPEPGDRIDELLEMVHFDTRFLMQRVQEKISSSGLPPDLQQTIAQELQQGLRGYTYLED